MSSFLTIVGNYQLGLMFIMALTVIAISALMTIIGLSFKLMVRR